MAFAQAAGWGNPPFAQPTSYNANAQLSCTKNDLFPDDQVYGLRILHTPKNASTGDIIFLHGLTGNSYDTWTSRKGVYWPTQLLSNDFPNVRIMAFGYDADVTRLLGPVSKNNVRDHAASLIGDLASIREADGSNSRPIILVVHSLGGLVAKKALCLSEQSAEAHERQLHDRTIAIAFCGTPHRGSGIASFATGIAHILKAAHKRVNTDILALLKRDSEVLAEIDAMFSVWLRKKGKQFTLTCFSEEHELPGVGMVVGKESSKIGGFPQYSIPANHMDMVRFNSQEDIGYRRIKGELQRWIRDGFTGGLDVQGCLKSLSFEEMDHREIEIENSAEGTCSWLLDHEVYQRWLQQSRGIIWIKGKPGAGKSTLMKFALNHAQATQGVASSIKTISFFFHGRGTTLQKSPLGLFRALAHQIGVTRGAYIIKLAKIFQGRSNTFKSWSWRPKELEDLLISSIIPAILEDMPVRLFIDALDECGDIAARQLFRTFTILQQRCSSSRFGLSICFSCRHYPIVAPDVCEDICLEHENEKDISLYIARELQGSIPCPQELELLQSTIEKKSQRVFQWVVLVVPRVMWLFQEGHTLSQILTHINQIPEELHSLYDSILDDLIKHRPDLSLKLFQWICFGLKAFNVSEFRCAMNVDATLEMSGKSFKEWGEVEYHIDTDQQMAKKVRFLSGGLAEITKSGIQLIHQSVQDFLYSKGFSILDPKTTWTEEIILGKGHGRLGRSCLVYFLAIRREHLTNLHLINIALLTKIAEEHPLLDYALKYWPVHISTAEKTGLSQADVLEFLPGRSNLCLEHWELFTSCLRIEDTSLKLPHQGTTMVHEAAKYNIPSLATSALGWMRVNVRDGRGRTALSIAAQHSGIDMVRLLLAQPGIDINIKDRDGRTALSYAMELDDLEVVEALLDRPDFKLAPNLESTYKLNERNGSTFDHVVRLQRLELLKMILEHPAVGCIDADALVGTALIYQSASSSASGTKTGNIIQLLMDSDKSITTVDLNKPRDFPRYSFLFDNSVMRIAPVLYFAKCGNAAFIEVFQFLASQSQVRLDVSDDKGNGLIHIALDSMRSYLGEDKVDDLKLLLAFNSLNVNALDGSGSPALTAAIEVNVTAGVRLEVVGALLARPDLDINRRDKRGRHPVCYAAELGAWDVVDLLLNDERLATTTGDRKFIQERRPLPRPKGTPKPQWKPEPQRMLEPQRTPEPPAPQPSPYSQPPAAAPTNYIPYMPRDTQSAPPKPQPFCQQVNVDWATFLHHNYQPRAEENHQRAGSRSPGALSPPAPTTFYDPRQNQQQPSYRITASPSPVTQQQVYHQQTPQQQHQQSQLGQQPQQPQLGQQHQHPQLGQQHQQYQHQQPRLGQQPQLRQQPVTWPLYEHDLTHSLEAHLPLLHHRDAHGNTLLAHIAIHGWESALSLLLSQEDVGVNAPSAEGSLTPLMLALQHRHNGVARDLLMRQDLWINMRDAWGRTALAYAADRGIASLLKSCGATY